MFSFYTAPCAPGSSSGPAAAVPSAPGRRGITAARSRPSVPAVRGRGRGRGRGRVASTDEPSFKSYDDPDTGNPIPPFNPSRPAGYHFGRPLLRNTMTMAVEFFYLFFTVEMMNDIVTHTNNYANEHIFSGTHQSYAKPDGSWQDVTADEIKRLIAILIYFGLVKVVGDVDKYWSKKTLFHGLWARAILSRKRFKALMALLHVVDPATENKADKLCKVESFINYFKSRCLDLYQPKQNLAVDERMVKSRHRSGIRQFIKDKPNKWGIKLWVLADSSNGYTVDFNVYIGKAAGQNVSANGLGYDVVMKLMRPFLNQGYRLFVDNFYTSVKLFKDLYNQGVVATGTIIENRREFPASLKDSKGWAKGRERGTMRWERVAPCLAIQWVDNKVVSLLTTIDNANDYGQVTRKCKTAGVWSTKVVSQPKAIANYNKYMNAVDRSDQILATNNVNRKCMRWWKTLFFHLIDIAVVNSFLLFKEHQAKFPDNVDLQRPTHYSLGDFREEIVRQLCDLPEYDVPPALSSVKPAPPSTSEFMTVHIPRFTDVQRRCVVCVKKNRGEFKVRSFCSAPQCRGQYMHVTTKNCFEEFHSEEYHK